MIRKRFLIGLMAVIIIANFWYVIQQNNINKNHIINIEKAFINSAKEELPIADNKIVLPKKSFDLYSNTPYDLPLISIYEISKLSPLIKSSVDNLLEQAQGFYYLKVIDDKVFVLLQNPVTDSNTYPRHSLQLAEIDNSGNIVYHTIGYSGIENEINYSQLDKLNNWIFDTTVEPYRPLKHTAYYKKRKVQFIEKWNYQPDEIIKYEMKDADDKMISLLKEEIVDNTNFRKEHIFYDTSGNILNSITINFDGANITRFNYYNEKKEKANVTIITDYVDGLKSFEKVYDNQNNLSNIVEATYNNGERTEIIIYDAEKKELDRISS